jgi:hypothetical protein
MRPVAFDENAAIAFAKMNGKMGLKSLSNREHQKENAYYEQVMK